MFLQHLITQVIGEAHELMNNKIFVVFAVIVAFDYITGVVKASAWKVVDSGVGMKGLIKHSLVFSGILLFWIFAESFHLKELATGMTLFYVANYLLSILENFGVMGIRYPSFLKTKVESELKRYDEQISQGITNSELMDARKAVQVNIDTAVVDPTKDDATTIEATAKKEDSQGFDLSGFDTYKDE